MEIKGTIKNYRLGAKTQQATHMIIIVDGYDKKKAETLVGRKVVWKTPSGKSINGKVASVHGNKGAVRVRFEKGLPGQAIGSEVSIL